MKKDIHPKYYENAKIICSCGNVVEVGSTVEELKTELCSACHPFFTGKQKHVDSAGRIEKFLKKQETAKEKKTKKDEPKEKKQEVTKSKKDKKKKKK